MAREVVSFLVCRWSPALIARGLISLSVAALAPGCSIFDGETALEVYIGPNIPPGSDAVSTVGASLESDFDGEVTAGTRISQWMAPFAPLDIIEIGLGLDVSGALQDLEGGDYTTVPITLMPMVRIPLAKSDAFPHGWIQPYVGVGPSIVWSQIEIPTTLGDFQDEDVEIGLDARAGVAVMLLEHLGVFAEYRLTWSDPEFVDDLGGTDFEAQIDAAVHHVLFGASLRF